MFPESVTLNVRITYAVLFTSKVSVNIQTLFSESYVQLNSDLNVSYTKPSLKPVSLIQILDKLHFPVFLTVILKSTFSPTNTGFVITSFSTVKLGLYVILNTNTFCVPDGVTTSPKLNTPIVPFS